MGILQHLAHGQPFMGKMSMPRYPIVSAILCKKIAGRPLGDLIQNLAYGSIKITSKNKPLIFDHRDRTARQTPFRYQRWDDLIEFIENSLRFRSCGPFLLRRF